MQSTQLPLFFKTQSLNATLLLTYVFFKDKFLTEGLMKADGDKNLLLEEGRSSCEHGIKPLEHTIFGDLKEKRTSPRIT